jgi:hypothetical protein
MMRVDERLPGKVVHPSRWAHALVYCTPIIAVGAFSAYQMLSAADSTGIERVLNTLLVTLPLLGAMRSIVSGQRYVELSSVRVANAQVKSGSASSQSQ